MFHTRQNPQFPDNTDQDKFIQLIKDTLVKNTNCKNQKKVRELYHNVEFNTKLKS